ncbi:MAG: HEAT repeat domain-containing protein [Pirellulaceae bacterium]
MGEPAEKGAETVPAKKKRQRRWLTFSLRSLMLLLTLVAIGLGVKLKYDWYRKKWLAGEWIAPLVNTADGVLTTIGPAPSGVRAEDEIALLQFGILELDTPEQRFAALKILVETRQEESLPALRELIPKSRHPEMQAMLLHLVSLARDPKDIKLLEPWLTSRQAEVRGAAAESLGYIHQPSYGFAHGWQLRGSEVLLNTNPPVDASSLVNAVPLDPPDVEPQLINQKRQEEIPAGLRDRLEALMLRGESQEERTAAARALVAWPPVKYKLRLAEWGVWIDGNKRLEVAKSVLEEIPPFVHRAGNPAASLTRNRYSGPIIITKPIVHLTADRPLAVDLEVGIVSGRPWYAFPRPEAFTVHLDDLFGDVPDTSARELASIDPQKTDPLEPLSEGYPWVHPGFRSEGASIARYGGPENITQIGLRWQSLIVCPDRKPWTTLPEVPPARGFAWWESLRAVPSSWVTSQGETERFLYYDGPTLAKSPLSAKLVGNELLLETRDLFWDRLEELERANLLARTEKAPGERDCLFVEVHPSGARAIRFRLSTAIGRTESMNLTEQSWQTGDAVEKSLRRILHEHGLSEEETTGFIISWREKFLQNPGRRLLTFLTGAEYERMCPLEIRPKTTEQVRVGIVLTEL